MAETDEIGTGTLTPGEFAAQRGLDSAVLRLLADGGHIPTASVRRGTHRSAADPPLTVEEADRKGRAAYDEHLEALGRLVMKTQSRMRRLHATFAADVETAEHTTLSPEDQREINGRPGRVRKRPAPPADELPDGVDDLSPEARRSVLDLLRVLVVAGTGTEGR